MAEFFPLQGQRWVRCQSRKLTLQSSVGRVQLVVDYGPVAKGGRWVCPQREVWGLAAHQKLTPALQERLCFTVTLTGSYQAAAAVASKWGSPSDDATLHALVQRVGRRAQRQAEQRLQKPPTERCPQRAPSALGVLLVDGWQVRHRGPGWGAKRTKQNRVEWHEMKLGVYYQVEQAVVKDNGRAVLAEKVVVSSLGEPAELGQRLHWEAQRAGLNRCQHLEFLGDGAAWVWNLKDQRWSEAVGLLDFYHAGEHVWELGRTVHGEERAAAWVEPRLHQLRHGQERKVLEQIAGLAAPRGQGGKIVHRERNYFAEHQHRMNYQQIAQRGWPIGSGAVESACRQRQGRFKGPGQFWTSQGLQHLCALEEARHNYHWDELWSPPKM